MRQVLIYRGEDGFWIAECPSLPGCVTQGETQNAALANIKEAVQVYVGALEVGLGPACGMIIPGV